MSTSDTPTPAQQQPRDESTSTAPLVGVVSIISSLPKEKTCDDVSGQFQSQSLIVRPCLLIFLAITFISILQLFVVFANSAQIFNISIGVLAGIMTLWLLSAGRYVVINNRNSVVFCSKPKVYRDRY